MSFEMDSNVSEGSNDESFTYTFAHKWIIQNFSSLYTNGSNWKPSFLISDNFSPLARKQIDAYLELCPHGEDGKDPNCIAMFFCIGASAMKEELIVKYKVSILDHGGETFCCKESQNILANTDRFGWGKYIKAEHLHAAEEEVLSGDKLTIICEVEISSSAPFPIESIGRTARMTRSYTDAATQLSPFTQKWSLDNLVAFRNEDDLEYYPVNSQPINLTAGESDEPVQFYLKLYPIQKNAEQMKVYLFFKSKNIFQVKVQFKLTIYCGSDRWFVMGCQEYLTAGKGFGWSIPIFYEGFVSKRVLIHCEAQFNCNCIVPLRSTYISENFNLALSTLYSFTSGWMNLFQKDSTSLTEKSSFRNRETEGERLIGQIPLRESYFNAQPKVLDTLIHTWKIDNYSDFLDELRNNVIESGKFTSTRNGSLQFQLRLYPRGHMAKSNGFNSVYLVYCNVHRVEVKVLLMIGVLDQKGEKRFSKAMRHTFGSNTNPFYHEDYLGLYLIQNDILLNEEEGLLHEDSLTVHCEVQIIDDRSPEVIAQVASETTNAYSTEQK